MDLFTPVKDQNKYGARAKKNVSSVVIFLIANPGVLDRCTCLLIVIVFSLLARSVFVFFCDRPNFTYNFINGIFS